MAEPDFVKGASGPDPYASGLGIAAPYLGGASASASAAAGAGTTGTSFPASPADAELFTYVADGTNGVLWTFRYYLTGAYWAFVGGPPLFSEIATAETTTSTTYAALTTPGPSIVLPFAADYDVTVSAAIYGPSGAAAGFYGSMSYDIGGTGAADADAIFNGNWVNLGTGIAAGVYGTRRKTGLTAVTLTAKYKTNSGTTTQFQNRRLAVLPVKK